ncbi:MAG: GAF domain-containing protein [Pseudolabrys sp.]|nr:GAF domain-containing protein [Pseudolabrys sp.]
MSAIPGHVTLTTCDTEPIQFLGAVQPIGFLLTVNADWFVLRASENVRSFLNAEHDQVVGQPLSKLISEQLIHDIRGCLQRIPEVGGLESMLRRTVTPNGVLFDIAVHQSGQEIVLEFMPSGAGTASPLPTLQGMVGRIGRNKSTAALLKEAARQVRGLTGFDRVMVYRFDEDGAGEVVAESATGGLQPYFGLRYPASDIPVQARALYEKNFIRCIADVNAAPVPVTPALSPEGKMLDLSMSVLRSVSPIHIEYLQNMGVRASMSISILHGGKLWGLFACHHYAPKNIDLETRTTAELFGQMFSYMLEGHQREIEVAYDERTRAIHDRIAFAFADPKMSMGNIPEFLAGMTDYVAADGIGACYDGEVRLTGITPTRDEFLQLVKFLNKTSSGRVFATHHLSRDFPPAADFVVRAAGILSIPISRTPRDYLVFFRREVAKTVTWAGEPTKVKVSGPNGPRLTPRKSFEAWQEAVHNQSERWTKSELRAAENLRTTLVELVLRLSESARVDREGAEQHQQILIAELNHRVRNILGLVRGLISQSAASASDMSTFVHGIEHRIGSLANAHDLLTSNNWGPASLHALLRTNLEERIQLTGPDVLLEPKAFSAMALVIHEVVTNARKYGALSNNSGEVFVATSKDEIGNISISWRESGGPPVQIPTRRGFGSTILEQVIPFEVNGVCTTHFLPHGFALEVILPANVAVSVDQVAPETAAAKRAGVTETALFPGLLKSSLVVEDNLFVAIDAEEMLQKMGAETVTVANSVADALALLNQFEFSFALLDVNLGKESCLPVARALSAGGIPFAFGTGYGESLSMPDKLGDVPIVTKPYRRAAMTAALQRLEPSAGAAVQSPPGTDG